MRKYNSKSLKKQTNTPARQKVINGRMVKLIKSNMIKIKKRQEEINTMLEPKPRIIKSKAKKKKLRKTKKK